MQWCQICYKNKTNDRTYAWKNKCGWRRPWCAIEHWVQFKITPENERVETGRCSYLLLSMLLSLTFPVWGIFMACGLAVQYMFEIMFMCTQQSHLAVRVVLAPFQFVLAIALSLPLAEFFFIVYYLPGIFYLPYLLMCHTHKVPVEGGN